MNAPKLRFREFSAEGWNKGCLGELIDEKSAKFNPEKSDIHKKCIELEHISQGTGQLLGFTSTSSSKSMKNEFSKGNVLFGKLRPYLKKFLQPTFDGVCSTEIWVFKGQQLINDYLFQLVQTDAFINATNQSTGSKMPRADWGVVSKFELSYPAISEQKKIATFLSTVDQKISVLTKKHELLIQYKRGIMQKIFNQEIRFKDKGEEEFSEWSVCSLGDIADRVRRKNAENNQNILTISAQQGLINQQEYFTKSVSAKDVTGYYLLESGEFAYNKSYSKGYPTGAIKRLKHYPKGAVSTLYICFKLKNSCDESFFEHYFESGIQNQEIEAVAQEGARNHGLLNIGIEDFFGISISLPSLDEQKAIGQFLNSVDKKIINLLAHLRLTKLYKQGLLQQMFI